MTSLARRQPSLHLPVRPGRGLESSPHRRGSATERALAQRANVVAGGSETRGGRRRLIRDLRFGSIFFHASAWRAAIGRPDCPCCRFTTDDTARSRGAGAAWSRTLRQPATRAPLRGNTPAGVDLVLCLGDPPDRVGCHVSCSMRATICRKSVDVK